MNSNFKTGDNVLVIAGKDKGKTGVITKSDSHKGRVIVTNVNIVSKHRKPRSQTDKGGIKKEEAPIDVSNVQIICPVCGKATRISHKIDEKGVKHRSCKKCGALMDGVKRSKSAKVEKTSEKAEKAEVRETTAKAVKTETKKAEKVVKKPTKAVTSKVKVDTATTKRKTPQAKTAK